MSSFFQILKDFFWILISFMSMENLSPSVTDAALHATPQTLTNTQEHEPSTRLWSKQN